MMLKSRHEETAAQQNPVNTAPPTALLVVVLTLALIGAAYGLWRGQWAAATLHAVIAAITSWGLHAPRRGVPDSEGSPAAQEPAASSSDTPLSSCPQGRITLTSSEPAPQETALGTTAGSDSPSASVGLPIVNRFVITGRLHRGGASTSGRLGLVLPADADVTVASVIDVLLTVGHRILDNHCLTDQPLPQVDITAVDRTETPPPTTPGTGFTVRITNNLAARRSDIIVHAHQLPASEDGVLLIAATLLAGVEHLLNDQNRPVQPFISCR
ncbi:hypothetical protein ACFYE2_15000 [Kocuria sp. CPCC 205300]|uniref:hypothetical protein n=1 Tax=Kocuria sabuli TaxID=3071448 RepID=UPI0036DED14A